MSTRAEVFAAIDDERMYQDAKHGGAEHDQKHTLFDWLRFLWDEIAEAQDAARYSHLDRCRAELVQVAATAIAALEAQGVAVEPRSKLDARSARWVWSDEYAMLAKVAERIRALKRKRDQRALKALEDALDERKEI